MYLTPACQHHLYTVCTMPQMYKILCFYSLEMQDLSYLEYPSFFNTQPSDSKVLVLWETCHHSQYSNAQGTWQLYTDFLWVETFHPGEKILKTPEVWEWGLNGWAHLQVFQRTRVWFLPPTLGDSQLSVILVSGDWYLFLTSIHRAHTQVCAHTHRFKKKTEISKGGVH